METRRSKKFAEKNKKNQILDEEIEEIHQKEESPEDHLEVFPKPNLMDEPLYKLLKENNFTDFAQSLSMYGVRSVKMLFAQTTELTN